MRKSGKAGVSLMLVLALLLGQIPNVKAETQPPGVGQQIATDLVAGGVSVAAALSGSLPIAMAAGFLTKYISTYGVQGIKALIDYFKGAQPKNLGEINLYYVYLLDVKRNLYQTMISIRKATEPDGAFSNLKRELERVEGVLKGECRVETGCKPSGLNESLVNYSFLNIVLDAKQSLDISKILSAYEVKDTYQYLLLLYMDVIIVEQKLLDAQYTMLANRTMQTIEVLKGNRYLSNAEKEFQTQLLLNMALRSMVLADTRRIVIAEAMQGPLELIQKENSQLQDEIDRYHREHGLRMFATSGRGNYDSKYGEYLKKIQKDMEETGIQVDVLDQNPFQTGTALSGYYLNEKTLLLERDAFFQMKANKLKSTGEVADYQHRTKVLRAHANNMLLQLIQAVDQRNKEGMGAVEKPKHEVELEKLIAECKSDSACVADRLKNPETSVKNILVENFELAGQVFGQVPYMNVLEVNAVYQLIGLIYLEVFYSQNLVSAVEFDLFYEKQEKLEEAIRSNPALTSTEKELNSAMVANTVNKWRKRVLERKYDHRAEFETKVRELSEANRSLLGQLRTMRSENSELFKGLYRKQNCLFRIREKKSCKAKNALLEKVEAVGSGRYEFLGAEESKLPEKFWGKERK